MIAEFCEACHAIRTPRQFCVGCELSGRASFVSGAAVAFGLMGMAEAIREVHGPAIEACPMCLSHKCGWVIGLGNNPFDLLRAGERLCTDCYDEEKRRRATIHFGHPYRGE